MEPCYLAGWIDTYLNLYSTRTELHPSEGKPDKGNKRGHAPVPAQGKQQEEQVELLSTALPGNRLTLLLS